MGRIWSAAHIPDRLRADLRPHERVAAFAWAWLPRQHTEYFTLAPIGTLISVFDLVRGWFAIRRVRERSVAVGFPLDRRMAMAVTDERLIIWKATPRMFRAPLHLGDVPRSQIRNARNPYVGGGWQVVELRLVDGRGVRFLVDRHNAEEFVRALS